MVSVLDDAFNIKYSDCNVLFVVCRRVIFLRCDSSIAQKVRCVSMALTLPLFLVIDMGIVPVVITSRCVELRLDDPWWMDGRVGDGWLVSPWTHVRAQPP